ncbi:MAG: archaeal heat shock protein Hsp20 [Candidatus Hodarchaeota archaeon]
MPKKDEYDDEEDEDKEQDPFNFYKYFGDPSNFFSDPNKFLIDPNKLFSSKQFRQLFNDIFEKISKNLPPEFQNLSPEDIMREFRKNKAKFGLNSPIMYGFNINIGPDGRPTIDSFGNIKPKPTSGEPVVKSKREPLIEVSEEIDQILVIAEMPGVDRDDIELEATSDSLIISTKENAKRHYYKIVKLPSTINSDVAKARYTNGILEVRLKKIDERRTNIQID